MLMVRNPSKPSSFDVFSVAGMQEMEGFYRSE
jgi:hypothetical protein